LKPQFKKTSASTWLVKVRRRAWGDAFNGFTVTVRETNFFTLYCNPRKRTFGTSNYDAEMNPLPP
jgi:hypothetical protein